MFEKLTYKEIEVKKLNMELDAMMKNYASREMSMFPKNRYMSQETTLDNTTSNLELTAELEKKELALQEKEKVIGNLQSELEKSNQQAKEKYMTIEQLKAD